MPSQSPANLLPLARQILINDKLISADLADGDKFNLSAADATGSDAKNKCSC